MFEKEQSTEGNILEMIKEESIQWSSHRQIAPETSIPLGKLLRNFSNQTATSPFPPEHLQTPHSQSTNTE